MEGTPLHPDEAELKILGVDTHLFFISSFLLIFYDPINSGKKGVILSHPYIFPRMNPSPFLTDQDVPCLDPLPTKSFDAQSLSGTVSAVPRTSSCFLVCHNCLLNDYQIPPTPLC